MPQSRPRGNAKKCASTKKENTRITRSSSKKRDKELADGIPLTTKSPLKPPPPAAEEKSEMKFAEPEIELPVLDMQEHFPVLGAISKPLSTEPTEPTTCGEAAALIIPEAVASTSALPFCKPSDEVEKYCAKEDRKLTLHFIEFQTYSVKEFLDNIAETLNYFYYNDTEYLCLAALEKHPDDYPLLRACAKAYIEVGRNASAMDCLAKCIFLKPNDDYDNYMMLGSLHIGDRAITNYALACDLINLLRAGKSKPAYTKDLIKCYCAMAEVYLSRLGDHDAGDNVYAEKCTEFVQLAMCVDEDHPLAYQIMAKLMMRTNKNGEAKHYIHASIERWMPAYIAHSENVEDLSLPDDYPPEMKILHYEQRLTTVSILLQLKNFQMAEKILELLQTEDDQVMELQYYFGVLFYGMGTLYHVCAKYRLEYSMIINDMTKTEDDKILAHIAELLEELSDLPNGFEDGPPLPRLAQPLLIPRQAEPVNTEDSSGSELDFFNYSGHMIDSPSPSETEEDPVTSPEKA